MAGISVSPALVRLDLASSQPQFTLTYANNSSFPVNISLKTQDFTALEEGWRVSFQTPDPATFHYALSSWLNFTPSSFVLLPNKSQAVTVSVRTSDLTAGGHYASIIASLTDPSVSTSSAIAINSQLVSLVFVRTHTGTERIEAKIASFSPQKHNVFSLPQTFTLKLNNTGNTELLPSGVLIIHDFNNREVARGILNADQSLTLPESLRRYDIPITIHQPVYRLPGLYQATLTVTYAPNQTLTTSTQFFSFASKLNFIIFLVLIFLIFLLFHRLFHRHKQT